MDHEIPWPRAGDRLFLQDDNWMDACVGWSSDQWHGYAEGYRRAANILVRHVTETQREQDYLIYPIVFLYRQSIEVSLKYLLVTGSELLAREQSNTNHHRLVPLWQQCRPMIEEVWPTGPKQDLDAVTDILLQFEKKDPVSTVFRYPVNTKGDASLEASERINILNFAEVANRVFTLLESCITAFRQYLEYQSEMEREYRQ